VWTPVPGSAKAGAGVTATKLTTVMRSNGGTQLVYAGHPLYYFAGDKSAGQATGDGISSFGAKWWELNAAGRALTSSAKGGTAPKPSSSSSGSGGYVY
jgi:predicted lipoprotein with Yx(FWY)xxD motif